MSSIKEIIVDEQNVLFNRNNLFYKEFKSDLKQIKIFITLIVRQAPVPLSELKLLEQQVAELITNAIKHGNKSDPKKKVKVWYTFNNEKTHIIVEDEGTGFKDIEQWNYFNKKRIEYFNKKDFEEMKKYLSYRTPESDENDGGNALFAALEYWNGGFIFNNKRNAVAALRFFTKKNNGVELINN